jgi:hypothetical protein
MKLSVNYLKSLWLHKPFIRLYFLALFFIPVPMGILGLALAYRLPMVKQVAKERFLPYQLEGNIERLKRDWSEEDAGKTQRRWEGIKARVPNSDEAVSYWMEDLIRLFSFHGFEITTYKFGEPQAAYREAPGLVILPLNIKMRSRETSGGKEGGAFAGMIELVKVEKEIVENFFGVDLAEITVIGDGKEAGDIVLDFFLWVAFKEKN